MRIRKNEACLLVTGNPKRRRLITIQRVTLVTVILVRWAGELPLVVVFVAIRTHREFELVNRPRPPWKMTLGAINLSVLALERIR